MVEAVVPAAVQSATVGSQLVIVEQVFGPQLVVISQFVIVALVQVDVLSVVVASVVELSDDALSVVERPELSSVREARLLLNSESEPCVPSGVGTPRLMSINFGNGLIPGIGGSLNLPSPGPNRKEGKRIDGNEDHTNTP